MEQLLRTSGIVDALVRIRGASLIASLRNSSQPEILWWIYAAVILFAVGPELVGEPAPPLAWIVAICGAAGCAWGWLLTRSLFRAEERLPRWSYFVVAGVVAVEGFYGIVSVPESGGGVFGEVQRIAANGASLICISMIAMVFVEVFSGYKAQSETGEKRFRIAFASGYAGMIFAALVFVANAPDESFAHQIHEATVIGSAMIGVIGSRFAVNYRKRHPLPAPTRRKGAPVARDEKLGRRILEVLDAERCFATPGLKVADLAAQMGEQEYKVTQCVTGTLGYRNFNQLINERRIAHAKALLADPGNASTPILAVAFDCGFNSIGPFNRAFKEQTGVTPKQYQREVQSSAQPKDELAHESA